jgi:hypothetical protein
MNWAMPVLLPLVIVWGDARAPTHCARRVNAPSMGTSCTKRAALGLVLAAAGAFTLGHSHAVVQSSGAKKERGEDRADIGTEAQAAQV